MVKYLQLCDSETALNSALSAASYPWVGYDSVNKKAAYKGKNS